MKVNVTICENDINSIAVYSQPNDTAFVNKPNLIEKLLCITWEQKVQKMVDKFKLRYEIIDKFNEV